MIGIKIETEIRDDKIIKTAHFMGKDLYFAFPVSEQDNITDRLDPFVYALTFPMMEAGGEFHFEGDVSRSFLRNIRLYCKCWHDWFPNIYNEITITANEVDDYVRPENKSAVASFSGGLDSSYMIYKYKKHLALNQEYNLEKCIMVYGTDIPLKNGEQFKVAFADAKKMTDDLGIDLVEVDTNYKEVFNCHWVFCYSTLFIACLSFFSKKYAAALMASGSVYVSEQPWAQNTTSNQYLESDGFRVIMDDYQHTRTERAGFIKDWEAALKYLRICWQNEDKSKNCGKCEKCIRTKLNFLANGVEQLGSMPTPMDYSALDNITLDSKHEILYYQEILDIAKKQKTISDDELKKLQKFIKKQRRNLLLKNAARSIFFRKK